MGKKLVIKCDRGLDIGFDLDMKKGAPFHFRRIDDEDISLHCPSSNMINEEKDVCCHLGCCNCDSLNLEPLEE